MYEIEPGLVLFPGSTLGQFFCFFFGGGGGGGGGKWRAQNSKLKQTLQPAPTASAYNISSTHYPGVC